MRLRTFLCQTVSAAVFASALVGGQASAQEAGNAAEAADFEPTGQEIVVTARFRQEALQDTPIAITAVTGEDLLKKGAVDISTVADSAPNMLLTSGGTFLGKSASVSIRGVGEGDYNFAVEGAVGFYVDDVYHSTVFGSLFDLLDVERVEVLRGPQGTLFGKNSIGGAIRLVSNQPKGDNSASLRLTTGSFNRFEARGHMDLSLIEDRLALRVAANGRRRDGYMNVIDFACANPTLTGTGEGPLAYVMRPRTTAEDCKVGTEGGEDVWSGRATLKATLSDALTVTVAGDYSHDGGETSPYKVIAQSDLSTDGTFGNANDLVYMANYGVPYDERFITPDMYTSYSTFSADLTGLSLPNISVVDSWGLRGNIDWQLGDKISLKSITSYRTYDGQFSRDGDQSPLDVGGSRTWLEHEQFSQELRLSGLSFADRLEWTVGGFYFDSSGRDISEIHIPELLFWPPIVLRTDDPVSSETKAAFAHGILSLTDRLNLSAGLRYSDEKKTYSYIRVFAGEFRQGDVFFPRSVRTTAYDRVDWKIGADFKVTDDVMVYGLVSTGFRGGGFNPRPLFPGEDTIVKPEDLISYEGGFKADLFDRRFRLNVSAFYGEYSNLQQTGFGPDANTGAPIITRTNVGESTIQGLEVEAVIRPVNGLTFSGSLGLTDYDYKDLGSAAGIAGAPCLSCKPIRVPKTTYSLSAEYAVPAGSIGDISFGADYNYRSRVYYDLTNNIENSQAGYGLLNARIGWSSPDGLWDVAFNVTNITKEEYYASIGTGSSAGTAGTPGRPREWSLSIGRQF